MGVKGRLELFRKFVRFGSVTCPLPVDLELDVVHEGGDHGFPKFSFQLLLLRVLRLGRLLDHRDALHLLQEPPLPHLVHVLVLLLVVGSVIQRGRHKVDILCTIVSNRNIPCARDST